MSTEIFPSSYREDPDGLMPQTSSLRSNRRITHGFVLAGGLSSRMGRDKALLEVEGVSFLERAVTVLKGVADEVSVVTRPGISYEGFACLPDLVPGLGPLGGIWTALENLKGRGAWILSCDLPLMDRDLFMMMEGRSRRHDIVCAQNRSGVAQPLAGFYSAECLPVVRSMLLAGRMRVQDLLTHPALALLAISAPEHGLSDQLFTNVNTPTEFQRARAFP